MRKRFLNSLSLLGLINGELSAGGQTVHLASAANFDQTIPIAEVWPRHDRCLLVDHHLRAALQSDRARNVGCQGCEAITDANLDGAAGTLVRIERYCCCEATGIKAWRTAGHNRLDLSHRGGVPTGRAVDHRITCRLPRAVSNRRIDPHHAPEIH